MNNYKLITLNMIEEKFEAVNKIKKEEQEKLKNKSCKGEINICLFGTGHIGLRVYNLLKERGYIVKFFSDNNSDKWDRIIVDDIKCISPEKLSKIKNLFVIISLGKVDDVYEQLYKMGINNICKHVCEYFSETQNEIFSFDKEEICKSIAGVFDILADEISKKILYYKLNTVLSSLEELKNISYKDIYEGYLYCPENLIELKKDEVIVDCGAFSGDTLNYFINDLGYKDFYKYICFELNKDNCNNLTGNIKKLPKSIMEKIEIHNFGVSDKSNYIFYDKNSNASKIDDKGAEKGRTIKLDEVLSVKNATYIKMDIEGSELLALKGARQLIVETKPKLAVCLYHKIVDLWEIPKYINNTCSDYKIYIRHHSYMQNETVCYALSDNV